MPENADRDGATGPFDLNGRHAVVTGAGGGLGRGCALALARAGATVGLIGRSAETLEETARAVAGIGGAAAVEVCDVTDAAAVTRGIGNRERIDILVNNAGANIPEPFLEVSEADLDRLLSLNVKGAFLVAQAAARRMAKTGGGSIVNMSSQMGHVGAENRSVYCTTKHAIEGLTKALAVELAPMNIRVNAVAPTFVLTPMTAPFFEDQEFRREVLAQIPLGRLAAIEDVAAAVVFLASDASAMTTGASLVIDGGWTAR